MNRVEAGRVATSTTTDGRTYWIKGPEPYSIGAIASVGIRDPAAALLIARDLERWALGRIFDVVSADAG